MITANFDSIYLFSLRFLRGKMLVCGNRSILDPFRNFISEISLFIYSTLSYWQALATGGIVTGVVGLIERLSGYHLTKRAYVGLFVGTFLLAAFFLGWREEHRQRL